MGNFVTLHYIFERRKLIMQLPEKAISIPDFPVIPKNLCMAQEGQIGRDPSCMQRVVGLPSGVGRGPPGSAT